MKKFFAVIAGSQLALSAMAHAQAGDQIMSVVRRVAHAVTSSGHVSLFFGAGVLCFIIYSLRRPAS